jgi:spore germination cell wall hydrolase CwlJ-like protein
MSRLDTVSKGNLAGWAIALVAICGVSLAIPAIAQKADSQRDTAVWAEKAQAFANFDTTVAAPLNFDVQAPPRLRDLKDVASLTKTGTRHLRWAKTRAAEHQCLAEAVYYEARSESRSGQLAVADVVKNRVVSRHYPNTICGVVYQGAENAFACQFSFACDGSMDTAPSGTAWTRSQEIAQLSLTGQVADLTRNATHYHTSAVNPVWSKTLKFQRRIGFHEFYRPSWRERNLGSTTLSVAPPT